MVRKATRISRFVAAAEDQPVVVGLDVHKKTNSVALFSKEDGLVESYTCPSGEAALAHQLTELGINIEHVVYESGPTGFALSRVLTDADFDVSVIAASRRAGARSNRRSRASCWPLALMNRTASSSGHWRHPLTCRRSMCRLIITWHWHQWCASICFCFRKTRCSARRSARLQSGCVLTPSSA